MEDERQCPSMSMRAWIEQKDQKTCRPCMLGPVVQWYHDELTEQGRGDLAAKLERAATESEPVKVAQTLDDVKAEAGEDLARRLKDFDCAAQTVDLEEVTS